MLGLAHLTTNVSLYNVGSEYDSALTGGGVHFFEMFLDQNRAFECAPSEFPARITIDVLRLYALFFFDTNEHFCKQETLKFLP